MQNHDLQLLETLIRDIITESLTERKKPGGPLTDYGALRKLNKKKADAEGRKALKSAEGDIHDAAKAVGVADRTFYHYMEKDPGLEKAQKEAEKQASSGAVDSNKVSEPKKQKRRSKPAVTKSRKQKNASTTKSEERPEDRFRPGAAPNRLMNPDINSNER